MPGPFDPTRKKTNEQLQRESDEARRLERQRERDAERDTEKQERDEDSTRRR